MTVSPEFTYVGHKWALILYPGGHSDSTDGMISVYLACKLSSKVAVKYDIIIRRSSGEPFHKCTSNDHVFFVVKEEGWGRNDYVRRDILGSAS
jgi:hypothetical protein